MRVRESLHSGAQRKVWPNVSNVTFLHEEDNKLVIIAKPNSRLAYQVRLKLNQKENA
jgi:hypothetical protein